MHQGGRGVLSAIIITGTLITSGCAADTSEQELAAKPTISATPTATPNVTPTPTPPADTDNDGVPDGQDDFPDDPARSEQLYYESGDPVLPGYPIVVDTAQIDYRVASAISTPQAVALAPGVYVGYNPAVTDLAVYLESNVGDGDCAVRDLYAFGGGSCWNGVLASPAEPAQ